MARKPDPTATSAAKALAGITGQTTGAAKALAAISGQSALSRMADLYGSGSTIAQMRDLCTGGSAFARMSELYGSKSTIAQMRELYGGRSTLAKMGELYSGQSALAKMRHLYTVPFAFSRVLGENRTMIDSIAARQQFADVIGADRPFSEIVATPGLASLVGAATMPRPAWTSVLEDLRPAIGDELYAETAAEFDAASEIAGEGETWWIARLPLVMQIGLLIVVLQALDAAGKFLEDLTGANVPPAYRSGVQFLFTLAIALMGVHQCPRGGRPQDSDESDEDPPQGS